MVGPHEAADDAVPPTAARPSVTVVIPSYRRPERLPALVRAFAEQGADEIVVVLDGPHPGAAQTLTALAIPALTVLELPENVGVARARVAGWDRAAGDVVLLGDDDVMPGPGVVDAHRRFHAPLADAVLVGYMPVADPDARGWNDAPTRLYAREYEGATRRWESDPSTILPGLWGGAVSLPTALARRAEELMPSIPIAYSEDLDLGLRLVLLGATGHFDRSVASSHRHRRGWWAYLRESRSRGHAAAELEARWGELPAHLASLVAGSGSQVRVAGALARLPLAVTVVPLTVVYAAAGVLRALTVQEVTCRLARRLLAVRSYRAARGTVRGASAVAADHVP